MSQACLTNRPTDLKQLSAQLKTRLKYAMLKVQNGWESQSIEQIETLSAHQHTPESPASKFSRRPSTSSEGYLASPVGQTSPSRQMLRVLQSRVQISATPAATALMAVAGASSLHPPSLAPAPPIISPGKRNRRSLNGRAPPMLSKPSLKQQRSGPRVPVTPTSSGPGGYLQNQAEKDAVDSLLFMSSPNNSNNMKYSQEPQSASRPKRVDFEIPLERS